MTGNPPHERWQEISRIYNEAIMHRSSEREAYVEAACGTDSSLRGHVQALLSQSGTAGFLDDVAARFVGGSIAHYQVTSILGVGGMGIVYGARDTRLGRNVAIKVLPPAFANDPDRVARFEREAQLLASLNHPHIAAIYGIEHDADAHALILEFVEGETLANRIARGALPLDEALPVAKQIAEAMEAAHETGIIHRDLKPSNIKLNAAGRVKVLDFGLAKAIDVPLDAGATQSGALLGTAAYMSPEQARSRPADRRSDIFAFGCVLFEMLAGRPPFSGDSLPEILTAVIKDEPAWSALPADTPEAIRRLLRRCLHKDRTRRLQSAGDARVEIDDAMSGTDASPSTVRVRRAPYAWIPWAVAIGAIAVLAMVWVTRSRATPEASAPEIRLDVPTPGTADPASFALSPDGKWLVFVASDAGTSRLWIRPLGSAVAQPITGTDGAAFPFWSPDSSAVGFFADLRLKLLDISGGGPQQPIAQAAPRGGTWNKDGTILFARTVTGPIYAVPAKGGSPVQVTQLREGQTSQMFPVFLDDGRHFLYFALGGPSASGLFIGSVDSPSAVRVAGAFSPAAYAPSRSLAFFFGQNGLVAQHIDVTRGALVGDPTLVTNGVAAYGTATLFSAAFSVSSDGVIAYRANSNVRRQLTWFDRSGNPLGTLGDADDQMLSSPSISPDGRRVAIDRISQGNRDVWIEDSTRLTRFTYDSGGDAFPQWSPDGQTIVFDSNRRGQRDLFMKKVGGTGTEELLYGSMQSKAVNDWSRDGRYILFLSNDPKTTRDLWILPLEGERKPYPFLKTEFEEWRGQFSPDGHWVVYQSNESGRYEIYVRPFQGSGRQWQISTGGGISPRWSKDGHELYYVAPDSRLMAVPVKESASMFEFGGAVPLFQSKMLGGGSEVAQGWQYDVAKDGRFLMNVPTEDATAAPITIILNWAGLRSGR